jgi:zinc protease
MMKSIAKLTVPRLLASLICAVLVLLPLQARAYEIGIKDFTLSNGMRIVLIPEMQSPAVIHSLWFRVGAADDEKGKTGLAHYLEHLMYKGTKTRSAGEYFRTVDQNGAEINAFTTRDYTVYHVRMAKEMLPKVMELEAERMRDLVIREEEMVTEREVVKEERRERYENDPAAQLSELMDEALLPDHPYGHPGIGYMQDVTTLSKADAEAFYSRYYHPNNAVVVISGALTIEEVKDLAETFYASLSSGPKVLPRQLVPQLAKVEKPRIEMVDPQARSDTFRRDYRVPSFRTSQDKEAYALDFLATILASGTQGRLFEELVIKRKIAADLSANYAGNFLLAGELAIWAVPNQGYTPADVEKAIDEVLSELIKNGVTQAEVDRALKRAKISSVFALDRQMGLVEMVGAGLMNGWEPRDVMTLERWEGVTAKDVTEAARKYLKIDNSVTGVLLRKKDN